MKIEVCAVCVFVLFLCLCVCVREREREREILQLHLAQNIVSRIVKEEEDELVDKAVAHRCGR